MPETHEWGTAPKDGTEINVEFSDRQTRARARWNTKAAVWEVLRTNGSWGLMKYLHGGRERRCGGASVKCGGLSYGQSTARCPAVIWQRFTLSYATVTLQARRTREPNSKYIYGAALTTEATAARADAQDQMPIRKARGR
jgi:hypothetical protein